MGKRFLWCVFWDVSIMSDFQNLYNSIWWRVSELRLSWHERIPLKASTNCSKSICPNDPPPQFQPEESSVIKKRFSFCAYASACLCFRFIIYLAPTAGPLHWLQTAILNLSGKIHIYSFPQKKRNPIKALTKHEKIDILEKIHLPPKKGGP